MEFSGLISFFNLIDLPLKLFQLRRDFGIESAVILFVIEDEEQNQPEQRHIQYRLEELSKRRVKYFRLTLTECGLRFLELYFHPQNSKSVLLWSRMAKDNSNCLHIVIKLLKTVNSHRLNFSDFIYLTITLY